MKKKIADKWIKALRSGKYKQGKKVLKLKSKRGVTRHCCLGVLCELYQKEHDKKMEIKQTSPAQGDDVPKDCKLYMFHDCTATLPKRVMRWAGMSSDEGFVPKIYDHNGSQTLAELNDNGCPFKEIAEIIAKDWDAI